ncbi:hypothetical protein [Enterobacter hormaechei]|uniref:hypothetical protein n=1 Tax=Enterobacter hormaechei TaxID=158836 RepID=UPI0020209185|nr:hypothetical protein [Enterobacter hormaechei]MCL8180983.1 hypothetical protein [Enterobacter hormaechei]MCM7038527.1 hypothetical protein [Enterobacter hormaechei]
MSNIDKHALIAKIKKQTESFDTVVLKEDEANALLDELEAKDKSISFLKDQLAQLANFNPDWDKLEAATYSPREHMAELTAARKRIAELEAVKCKLSDSKLLSLAKDIVENLVDTGASDPEYTQQYIDWACKRIRAAAGKGE